MIAFSWRQFRLRPSSAGSGLVVVGASCWRPVPTWSTSTTPRRRGARPTAANGPGCNNPVTTADAKLQVLALGLVLVGARPHRDVLGRTPRRPRARDGHVPPGLDAEREPSALAAGQARPRRPGQRGGRRCCEPDGHVVVQPHRQGDCEPFSPASFGMHGFVPAGYALFAFALGATTGLLVPAHAARHGRDARRLHRGAGRRGGVDPAALHDARSPRRSSWDRTQAGASPSRARGRHHGQCQPTRSAQCAGVSSNIVNKAGQSPSASFLKKACPCPASTAADRRAAGVRRAPSSRTPRHSRSSSSASTPSRRSTTRSSSTSRPTVLGLPDRTRRCCSSFCLPRWPACACGGCATGSTEVGHRTSPPPGHSEPAQCWCERAPVGRPATHGLAAQLRSVAADSARRRRAPPSARPCASHRAGRAGARWRAAPCAGRAARRRSAACAGPGRRPARQRISSASRLPTPASRSWSMRRALSGAAVPARPGPMANAAAQLRQRQREGVGAEPALVGRQLQRPEAARVVHQQLAAVLERDAGPHPLVVEDAGPVLQPVERLVAVDHQTARHAEADAERRPPVGVEQQELPRRLAAVKMCPTSADRRRAGVVPPRP